MNAIPSARRVATPTELAFSVIYGLPPHLAAVLGRMVSGETVTGLRANIHRLRAALPTEAIDTGPDGYQLTEVGRTDCNQAIVDFRNWIQGEAA